jgi:3-oxoacyl-[acyl-carrier protein] reductase
MDPHGRLFVVSGGSGNIGKIIAAALRSRGAQVAVLDKAPTDGESDACIPVDLADEAGVAAAVSDVVTRFGPIHGLVNCAGTIHNEPLVNLLNRKQRRHRLESWDAVLKSNLTTTFLCSAHVAEHMLVSRTKGVIVNISSISARGNPGQTAYAAAKAGVEAMTIVWASELGAFGIRTVAVAPGFIDTPSTRAALNEAAIKELVQKTPLRRLGKAEDVAGAVLFAIENDFVTGCVIGINGGMRI